MLLSLNAREEKLLMHLLFSGNVLLNGNRMQDEILKNYDLLFQKVLKQYLEGKKRRKIKNCDVDDFFEIILPKIEPHVSLYEKKSLPYTLAKMLADYHFPFEDYNSNLFEKNLAAHEIYENELLANGVKIIRLDIPDFEEKLKRFTDYTKA